MLQLHWYLQLSRAMRHLWNHPAPLAIYRRASRHNSLPTTLRRHQVSALLFSQVALPLISHLINHRTSLPPLPRSNQVQAPLISLVLLHQTSQVSLRAVDRVLLPVIIHQAVPPRAQVALHRCFPVKHQVMFQQTIPSQQTFQIFSRLV
jgi:hypothetical protein